MAAPSYYKKFRCAASECRDTCCQGWQISIDAQSWKRYVRLSKAQRRRDGRGTDERVCGPWIKKGLDFRKHAFAMEDGKCAFLDKNLLCRLQKTGGQKLLCDTCRRYPRHMEAYGGLKEFSLSLSCPEAAKMILAQRGRMRFDCVKRECRTVDKKGAGRRRGEKKMLKMLLKQRKQLFSILQNPSLSLKNRIAEILAAAQQEQAALRGHKASGRREKIVCQEDEKRQKEQRYVFMASCLEAFGQLEPIQKEWKRQMQAEWNMLYADGFEQYEHKTEDFKRHGQEIETIGEKILAYFLYVYFLGGMYDGQIESKVKFAVLSWLVIREWAMARKEKKGSISLDDWIELSSHYSREVEHSDENLEMLERMAQEHPLFQSEKIVCAL